MIDFKYLSCSLVILVARQLQGIIRFKGKRSKVLTSLLYESTLQKDRLSQTVSHACLHSNVPIVIVKRLPSEYIIKSFLTFLFIDEAIGEEED